MSEVIGNSSEHVKNMSIWDRVCNTPPERTQKFQYSAGGRQFNDVNPQWRLQVLTETFGPCGHGWGYEIMERWREKWGDVECCYVMLRLWYFDKELKQTCFTGPQIGGTAVTYSPDECWKMSVTDALGKCAALLGVAADIYLGVFDTKYRDKAAFSSATPASVESVKPPVTASTAKKTTEVVKAPPTAATQQKTPF